MDFFFQICVVCLQHNFAIYLKFCNTSEIIYFVKILKICFDSKAESCGR